MTAALGVVGITNSMAQAVYSVNAVGFVNVDVPSGFSIICNPLTASNNNVTNLFPGSQVVEGLTLYKYDNVAKTYIINAVELLDAGVASWTLDNMTLAAGEAAFILNPSPTNNPPLKITFVGEVPQGNLTHPTALVAGFSLIGSQVPQQLVLTGTTNGMSFPAGSGDTIYFFRNKSYSQVTQFTADPTGDFWDSGDPVPFVGEGFWVSKVVPASWTRTFSVNPTTP